MDEVDIANENAENLLRLQLSARKPVPEQTGLCLNCDEPTAGRFCDVDCRHDFERRNRER